MVSYPISKSGYLLIELLITLTLLSIIFGIGIRKVTSIKNMSSRANMTLLKQQAYLTKATSIAHYSNTTFSVNNHTIQSSDSNSNEITSSLFDHTPPEFNHKGYWGFNYLGSTRVAGSITLRDYPLKLRLSIGNSQITLK